MKPTHERGTLFLVATPIGNLEDITLRALRVFREADAVLCEDTRRTSVLLRHHGINKPGLTSFHEHSGPAAVARVKQLLGEGKSVAYATDAGMPVVSDPGFLLVRAARECGAMVTVIPGASAAVSLFAASGLASPKYLFHGFFPRTRGEVERTLEVVRELPVAHVFYEAPGRVQASLGIVAKHFPIAQAALGRELTKLHEEILRGTVSEIAAELSARERVKGECVFAVLGGASRAFHEARTPAEAEAQEAGACAELTQDQQAEIAAAVKSGASSRDAAKEFSKKFQVARRVVYEFIVRRLT